VAAVIFVVSFVFICARRVPWLPIGRPAAALIGAVCLVGEGMGELNQGEEACGWEEPNSVLPHFTPKRFYFILFYFIYII
jgi:hypothetical protein